MALSKLLNLTNPSQRVDFLASIANLDDVVVSEAIQFVAGTYSLLTDKQTRSAAEDTLVSLISADNAGVTEFLASIDHITSQTAQIAVTDVLTALSWTNAVIEAVASNESVLPNLILAQAKLLYKIVASPDSTRNSRIHASAIRTTRTSLVKTISSNNNTVALFVNTLTQDKSVPVADMVVLGTLAGAVVDVLPSHPGCHATFESLKPQVYNAYIQSFLASKVPLSTPIVSSLIPFFSDFTTQEDFDSVLVPAISKAMLRAPETVLVYIVPELLANLSALVDLSASVNDKLLSAFLSSFGSSKPQLREDSLKTLSIALNHCYSEDNRAKIATSICQSLKKVTNADQKVLYGKALHVIPTSEKVSSAVVAGLNAIAFKEVNETALDSLASALSKHIAYSLAHGTECDKPVKEGLFKCLADNKKPVHRRIWATSLVKELESTSAGPQIDAFSTELETKLKPAYDEIVSNPATAVQNKGVAAAFAYLVLMNKLGNTSAQSLITTLQPVNSKPALLSYRTYTKLTTDSDFYWAISATSVVANSFSVPSDESFTWGLSFVFYALSKTVPHQMRPFALEKLRDLYSSNPATIGLAMISTLVKLVSGDADSIDAELPRSNFNVITSTLFSLSTSVIDPAILEEQLAKVAVISHHPSAMPKYGWIGLIQRAGIDPGQLVKHRHEEIIDSFTDLSSTTTFAAHPLATPYCRAVATLCFIDPELVTPVLTKQVVSLLDPSDLNNLSSYDIRVWSAPEDTIVPEEEEDESKKRQYVENKNTKDYELKKWEESVRKAVDEKKKASSGAKVQKKFTKEELQTLEKQKTIKANVQSIVDKLEQGLGISCALSRDATKVSNGVEQWFSKVFKGITTVLKSKSAAKLVGQSASDTLIELSGNLSERLNLLRPFVSIALLRALYTSEYVDEKFTQEPLKSLVDRILYRLKFLSDQAPLDSVTLTFIVPLLLRVIHIEKGVGGIGTKNEEEAEEQLLLSIDILTAHAEAFRDETTPRADLLTSLLNLMQRNPAKAKQAKECILSVVQSISLNISSDELKVLLGGVVSGDVFTRTVVLEAIDSELDISDIGYSSEIWISCFDDDSVNAELGADIWRESEFKISDDNKTCTELCGFLESQFSSLRRATARALAAFVAGKPEDRFDMTFKALRDLFIEKAKDPEPVYDKFGIAIKTTQQDPWEARSGCALAFRELANWFTDACTVDFFKFLISDAEALGDKNELVRQEVQQAGLEVIKHHGLKNVESLIPVFEAYLARPDSETKDVISESVIILYGALAQHLSGDDPRLTKIVERLLVTLDTPSEDVQVAVSECLSPLVNKFKGKLEDYLKQIMTKLLTGEKFAERRGAAYGLAGLVKGAGIASLADYEIIRSLTDAIEDKKDPKKRQGAQFAFECLSQALGKLFEPYVIELLPLILTSLGDNATEVREATSQAARVIMKSTTGYGVKQLIPLALENLDQTAWRAKKGSVDLLGTMAYLDPQQLSASLSTIIPEIVGVLNDTHKEVRNAASQSLKRFGDVIRNPEIKSLVPILVKAIGNPLKHTDEALDGLLKTQFVHFIDAPSLALVIHVLNRGLKDRSAATKKKACQIVGNMSILTDSKDLIPYLGSMVAELEVAMVDPVPGTRAMASRALGTLVEKLGEEQFPDLIPRLLSVLRDESRAGDRLGSAQALSEVIYGLGIRKLEELLPTILSSCTSSKYWIREGFMPLMIYLPSSFGASLSPYLNQIIPPILSGLADSVEGVRDTALKAGRLIVRNYSRKAVDLLLPELERGLSDINHRIRLSSVELTGDLLYQITGISSSGGDDQDQAISGQVSKTLIEVLGQERRDRVLAALFMCRSDTSGQVRLSGIEVWKSLVANTPRTVKEILPTLTQLVIRRLASPEEEHRRIGAQTLGELVRRVGGNALSQLLPTLEEGLVSSDSDAKQGICIALGELIQSAPEEALEEFQGTIIRIVRETLVDADAHVREAAAHTFDVLQEVVGNVAVDHILPDLIKLMQSPEQDVSENAFAALKEMMATKSTVVFPVLIPTLLQPPMTAFKAQALGSLATVSGTALYKRLSTIIDAFYNTLVTEPADADEIHSSLDKILLSVVHDEGTHMLMQQLLALAKHEDSRKRRVTLKHMPTFFAESHLDYSTYTGDWISLLVSQLDDRDSEIVQGAWQSLSKLVSKLSKEEMEHLVKTTRSALQSTGAPGHDLPGFELPKGPNCVLPIFLQGLMYGSSDEREQAALGIADIVERTSATNLKPFVTQMTGPLIRTIGERFPSDVKAAILYTLNVLLMKIPTFLKPFLPQLQRTFAKSLSDPSNELLRKRAAKALGTLITLQARIDPLVTELMATARSATDLGVISAMHNALAEIVTKAGSNLSDASKQSLIVFVTEQVPTITDPNKLMLLARIVGGIVAVQSPEEAAQVIRDVMADENVRFALLSVNAILKFGKQTVADVGMLDAVVDYLVECSNKDNGFISENGVLGLGKVLLGLTDKVSDIETLVKQIAASTVKTDSRSPDTRRLALVIIRTVGRLHYETIAPFLDVIVPAVFACVRDTIIPVKLAAEKAYLTVLKLVDQCKEEDGQVAKTFDDWFTHAKESGVVPAQQQRSISDYTKRVALRLANAERDRIDAGGDDETVFSDRIEDETEIWAIGSVEIDE